MKAYLAVVRLRFLLLLQYRMAAAAGIFTQLFFGLVKVMVVLAFFHSSGVPQPLSLHQTVTYTWLVQAYLGLLPWNGDLELVGMIRTGNIAYELCRPVDLYILWSSRMLAQRLAPTLLRSVPILLVAGLLLPGEMALNLPASWTATAAWFAAMAGALLLSTVLSNFFTIATMWTIAGFGVYNSLGAVFMLLSGSLVPLAFFPDWAQPLLQWLPFSGAVDAPFRFYVGAYTPSQIFVVLPRQLIWTALLAISGRWILSRAMHRVAIQGG